MISDSFTVIRTKLHRAHVTRDVIDRSRLTEQLDRGLARRLTLISAPAGYGKTTLASAWLETSTLASAWLSLDEYDNDLVEFIRYFIAAIQTVSPDVGHETHALLQAAEPPPIRILAGTLINELEELSDRFILVLDDYQYIEESPIQNFLGEFLRHPLRALHLVLLSRTDPPLDLVKLRARGQMTDIRATHLRFTVAETGNFLRDSLGRYVEDSEIALLTDTLEGWAAGLRLTVLSLRNRGDLNQLLESVQHPTRHVDHYLTSEVLAHQSPAVQEYLLATSILDRFCAPLSEALLVDGGSGLPNFSGEAFVEWLEVANLFVVPLDDQHKWYRYHHLFQELLSSQLESRVNASEVAVLHQRAGLWFAEHGYIDEALRHALAAGDTTTAVELVAQQRHNLLNQEQWHYLNRWLRLFPRQLIEETPDLLVAKAWTLYNLSQYPDMVVVLDQAETLLSQMASKTVAAKHLQAEIDAMRSEYVLLYEVDSEQAVALARRALSEIPHDWFNVRGLVHVILAYGYLMLGKSEQGLEIINDALKADKSGSSAFRGRLLTALCFLHYSNADMQELRQAAIQLLELGQADDLSESVAYARYFLGCFHYLRNELVEAERHLVVAASDRHIAQIWATVNSACVLALTNQALGKPNQAKDTAEASIAFLSEMENVEFQQQLAGLQAELALRQEYPGEASRWAQQFDPYPLPLLTTFYVPQMTLVKVLLAQDTTVSRQQAADLLAKLYDHVLHDRRYMIEVLALQALLDDAQGDKVGALDKLERSIHLAEPVGYIRPFVDLGMKMADLLTRLGNQGFAPHYISQILDAFAADPRRDRGPITAQQSANDALIEPLTPRELEVLTLLAQQLSNKEIAAQLIVTPGTVRQHTHHIYQKLQVENRQQAVAAAIDFDILPPPA